MGKKKTSENIRVVIRCRDLLKHELEKGHKQAVRMDLATNQVLIQHAIGDPDSFAFDAVFNNSFSQRDIFLQEVQPLVEAVMTGYNATVFAYGQSGSGKTYTMTGDLTRKEGHGMMPQVVDHLFGEIKRQTSASKQFKVKVSYVELYLGKSRDLLADKQTNLEIKQNLSKNFFVKGAAVEEVLGYDDCLRLFNEGTVRRQVASTDLNDSSSRSHSLFMLTVDQYDFEQDPSTPVIMSSKINVVDLAGSEKLSKTNATGDTAKEGCQINLSLSSLATVIDTIVKGGKHVPYRSSSLTMLLKDSLGGNSKTVMFANVGPSDHNVSETISTLRFAERAKQIKNQPVKNLDPKDARILELMEKIEDLQSRLGNVDLNVEDQLKVKIEELEVENAELRGVSEKDTLHLEEDLKMKTKEVEDLYKSLKEQQKLVEDAQSQRQIMEANFHTDLAAADELRSIATNFVKRVCTEQQIQLVRSKIPQEVLEAGAQQDQTKGYSVRELQYYLEGFVDLYEDWRSNAFTPEELAKRVEQAKADAQLHAQEQVADMQRQMQQVAAQRDADIQNRSADTEAQSQMKVEAGHIKEENQKLKEKIERDQEKFKKKSEKLRDEKTNLTEELEAARSDLEKKNNEVGKLKALLEEAASRPGGGGVSVIGGVAVAGSPSKGGGGGGGGGDHQALVSQLEEAQLKAAKFETRVKETNLLLRRKGICIQPGSAVAHAGGLPGSGGAPPGAPAEQHLTPDGEMAAMEQATDDLMITEMDDASPLDGDLITQLQQQIRVQHRLHELRHTQQRKLDDLIRKYEMVKTGTVTAVPDSSEGSISEEALRLKIEEAMTGKNAEIEELKAGQEKLNEKLVKKVNKKMAEAAEREAVLAEEKQLLLEERDEITAQCDQLTSYNTKVAVELESLRAQLIDKTSDQANDVRSKEAEIDHLKHNIEKLKLIIEENKVKISDYQNLQNDLSRMQQQHSRTEASLKEKITSLDNNRQMIKWSNSLLETEKKKVTELEEEAKGRERSFHEMEENWRAQLIENANKLVQINNKRLEEQAAQYQDLISEEQEKQKTIRVKLKKAKEHTQKAAQRYDEMVLENESLQTQYEELKISAMKMYRQRNEAEGMYGGGAAGGRKF